MTRIDFTRERTRTKLRTDGQQRPRTEIVEHAKQSTSDIIKGMGQSRYSPQAAHHMGAEPVRKINPTSPEGRAIAQRYLAQPP